jgi:regulator of protease activity HflC (stomatin/prohibitin superfamily)
MPEGSSSGDPIEVLLKSTTDLLRPEELVREATRDIVKDEIRRHLEKTLQEDPKLAQDLKDAVKDLLAARATEYAALVRVGTATARLGLSALPPEVRRAMTKQIVDLISKELGQIVERSL